MITKTTSDYNFDFQTGEILLIDKPKGWTSFKVIRKIRNSINVKKVGHSGTLDPMATGLLIVCTGKKTKEISIYQDLPKTYEGKIALGKTTLSMDTETEVISEKSIDAITESKIYEAKEKFTGKIKQIPPMFSAKKLNGKPLYKIARKGKVVERTPVEVEVYDFSIKKIQMPDVWFKIKCSRGTYIRSIANDLGEELGCGGLLSELRRTAIGDFQVEDALKPEEFLQIMSLMMENI